MFKRHIHLLSTWNYIRDLEWCINATKFSLLMSCCNVIIYNFPVILFTANNLDYLSLNGVLIIATVVIVIFIVTSLFLLVLCILSFNLAKLFCLLVALCNSIALYFVITYRVVLDTTMMSNVFNTNLTEASSYWHYKMILYLIMLGVIPSIFIYKFRINKVKRINLFLQSFVLIVVLISWTYLNANKLLWIDKYSSRLGARIMPWSYIGNTIRLQQLKHKYSSDQELLPPAQLEESDEKTITILVIGEAARAENFSLYGYNRPTNPLLEKQGVIALDNTVSCATYTTLSLRCILSHKDVSTPFSKQYEPLPSYLQRHGVDVVWRTNNWGEPPMKVNTYQRSDELERECKGDQCQYDEVLLSGLGERVRSSMQQNIFIVIHRWGSHGPSYYKRYSKQYEIFKPVCKSVELNQCTNHELVNAYDNSILYTDYFLTQTINLLQDLKTPAVMIYISDHGESLGEFGLYLHGVPYAVAPDVQTHIPFIVWMSPEFIEKKGIDINRIKQSKSHSHQNIFHSVLGAINMHSEVYNDQLDIFNTMIDNLGESDP